jgi:hypothetical protein
MSVGSFPLRPANKNCGLRNTPPPWVAVSLRVRTRSTCAPAARPRPKRKTRAL